MRKLLSGIAFLSLLITGCSNSYQKDTSRLDLIKERGELVCGISGKISGFSFLDINIRSSEYVCNVFN